VTRADDDRLRVGVLVSGRGSNLQALLDAAARPGYPARVVVVVGDKEQAPALARARAGGVAAVWLNPKDFGDRVAYDVALGRALDEHRVGLVCLAGFMRLLAPSFVGKWQGRMLNIHPALLPSFKGLDTHARALAAGVKIHGATVHLVVPEVDSGPIVAQAAVPVCDSDTPETLAARVLEAEHRIYPAALKLLAEGRITVIDGRCRIEGLPDRDAALFAPSV